MKKILARTLIVVGLLSVLSAIFWASSGNHGVTWQRILPDLIIWLGVIVVGVILEVLNRKNKNERN